MQNKYRLPSGGSIDRNVPIKFSFNGRTIEGYEGDTVASALLSNGIETTGRSFKYHRPRGVFSAGIEEPGTFVEVLGEGGAGSVPATMVPIAEGLNVKSINCWPGPAYDLGQLLQLISPIIPSGFYYKTFFQPKWKVFEPFIRKMAGLAEVPKCDTQTVTYDSQDAHCEFLIVGGGLAALIVANMAAKTGKRVILIDYHKDIGSHWSLPIVENPVLKQCIISLKKQLEGLPNVRILTQTLVWGYREQNLVLAHQTRENGTSELLWRIRSQNVILATGCTERGLVFPDNDRPGIMLASGLLNFIRKYSVLPGNRVILYANNNSIKTLANILVQEGKEIVAIITPRVEGYKGYQGFPSNLNILAGYEIKKTIGRNKIKGVVATSLDGGKPVNLSCDLLAVSGGWNPNLQLWIQSGGSLTYASEIATFIPTNAQQNVMVLGSAAGKFSIQESIIDTIERVSDLIASMGLETEPPEIQYPLPEDNFSIFPYWVPKNSAAESKSFVDMMNDVTLADIKLALREGYDDIELVKRFTTLGMGLDQGKTGNVNAAGIISSVTGKTMDEIGLIKYRAPFAPVPFGSLGKFDGEFVKPFRTTPITEWNRKNGAVLYEAGANWKRPGYYLLKGESMQEAINREALATRNGLAIYDGSPLGTFDVKGKDAANFLELIYTNPIQNLPIGMGRYGMMLTEEGFILDDGVCFRLGENWYLISVSTGNADLVHQHLEKHLRYDFPHLDVSITNLTLQWMNATVCGPKSREFLQDFISDIDLSPENFPFMGIRNGMFSGFPVRIARVSFTGELSFEINVRSRDLRKLWELLIQKGVEYGITPIGSETNHVLRVEKGFISLGHEVDGKIDPIDLGIGWVFGADKKDFIGKKAVEINRTSPLPRKELVGLIANNPTTQFAEGAPLISSQDSKFVEGHVTASVWSVINNNYVALALLNNGRKRISESVQVRNMGGVEMGKVTAPCFYDPEGQKLRS